jgi:hypothetical protein
MARVSLKPGRRHVSHEQTIFDLPDRTPCPHVVQTFFRYPDIAFMETLKNGNALQTNEHGQHVTPHSSVDATTLSDAAAYFESLGYVHGDTNPHNVGSMTKISLSSSIAIIPSRSEKTSMLVMNRMFGVVKGDNAAQITASLNQSLSSWP